MQAPILQAGVGTTSVQAARTSQRATKTKAASRYKHWPLSPSLLSRSRFSGEGNDHTQVTNPPIGGHTKRNTNPPAPSRTPAPLTPMPNARLSTTVAAVAALTSTASRWGEGSRLGQWSRRRWRRWGRKRPRVRAGAQNSCRIHCLDQVSPDLRAACHLRPGRGQARRRRPGQSRRPRVAGPRRPHLANHTRAGSIGVIWALSVSNVEGLTVEVVLLWACGREHVAFASLLVNIYPPTFTIFETNSQSVCNDGTTSDSTLVGKNIPTCAVTKSAITGR